MSKRAPFKYRNWKLSSQMDIGELVRIATWKFLLKNMTFQSYVTLNF